MLPCFLGNHFVLELYGAIFYSTIRFLSHTHECLWDTATSKLKSRSKPCKKQNAEPKEENLILKAEGSTTAALFLTSMPERSSPAFVSSPFLICSLSLALRRTHRRRKRILFAPLSANSARLFQNIFCNFQNHKNIQESSGFL